MTQILEDFNRRVSLVQGVEVHARGPAADEFFDLLCAVFDAEGGHGGIVVAQGFEAGEEVLG
jgi:hypothetical protein